MTLSQSIVKHIATLGPLGYIPIAPGTFSSLLAVLFVALLKPSNPSYIIIIIFTLTIGVVSADIAEKLFGIKDCQHIVIDEFAGFFVAMLFLPQKKGYLISAFIIYRVLDILKPPPLRKIEGLSGGIGIMADDIVAGIYTNIILEVWRLLTLS